jgi:hypothetical protein
MYMQNCGTAAVLHVRCAFSRKQRNRREKGIRMKNWKVKVLTAMLAASVAGTPMTAFAGDTAGGEHAAGQQEAAASAAEPAEKTAAAESSHTAGHSTAGSASKEAETAGSSAAADSKTETGSSQEQRKEKAEKGTSASSTSSEKEAAQKNSASKSETAEKDSGSGKVSSQKKNSETDGKDEAEAKKKAASSAKKKTVSKAPASRQDENAGAVTVRGTSRIDNSTTLPDGKYSLAASDFTFGGATGKAKISCTSVLVENGRAYAIFKTSSQNMTHFYMGETASNEENPALYNKDTGAMGTDVYAISDQQAKVPVDLNNTMHFAARSTAMSKPRWINYTCKITLAEPMADGRTAAVDNAADVPDGVYKPDAFRFSGGTGKLTISCGRVEVSGGKAYATLVFSSGSITQVYANGLKYPPKTKTETLSSFVIPVKVNGDTPMVATTKAMSAPHDVSYTVSMTLSKNSQKITDTEENKPSGGSSSGQTSGKTKNPEITVPTGKKTLKPGTYRVRAATDNRMFYLAPKESSVKYAVLTVKKNGKMSASFALTGEGYDYLYMGSPAKAAKASKTAWSRYKVSNGYYTYTVPVSGLDKKLTVSAHSKRENKWYPHTMIFYSSGAKKTAEASAAPSKKKKKTASSERSGYATKGKQTSFKNDKKKAKESKWKDDSSKSTSSVDSRTGLKDGVYTPDSFSWSGGSGRLAYIRCDKITVRGGQAYATIVFSSSSYDLLKANGRTYSRSGGGNSTFTIPVNLNANNTVIGRTTAMSQPHWIRYSIYIAKADSKAAVKAAKEAKKDAAEVKNKLTDQAPEILGLTAEKDSKKSKQTEVKYAGYFKIYRYKNGIRLLSINQKEDTGLEEKKSAETDKTGKKKTETKQAETKSGKTGTETNQTKTKSGTAETESQQTKVKTGNAGTKDSASSESAVEYDEEGKPIAKSQTEITEELYQHNVVNYLLVPEGTEVPAGLDKDYIIVKVPSKRTFSASEAANGFLKKLKRTDCVAALGMKEDQLKDRDLQQAVEKKKMQLAGELSDLDYRVLVETKTSLALLPSSVLPEKAETEKNAADSSKTPGGSKTADSSEASDSGNAADSSEALGSGSADGPSEGADTAQQEGTSADSAQASGEQSETGALTPEEAEIQKKKAELETYIRRFTVLGAPVVIDRSDQEEKRILTDDAEKGAAAQNGQKESAADGQKKETKKSPEQQKKEAKLAKAEWIKVYGALYGCEDEADQIFAAYEKKILKS